MTMAENAVFDSPHPHQYRISHRCWEHEGGGGGGGLFKIWWGGLKSIHMGSMGDLFMMLFLGIISWKGASRFNGGSCFSDGGASYLSEGCAPWGHRFWWGGGGSKKNCRMGGGAPPHASPTMGNPASRGNLEIQTEEKDLHACDILYISFLCFFILQYNIK